MSTAILTRIATKFQITVPTQIREIFDLREGDLFEWIFNQADGTVNLIPKRAQLITPLTAKITQESRERRRQIKSESQQTAKIAARAG
jgi:AbrB family looped-hinge helix DNA binding protein